METYTRSRTSRYVIDDDFIPKVTVDGEPHEIMTLVAGVSGIIAAFIVLAILMVFIGCKKSQRPNQQPPTDDDMLEKGDIKIENLHKNYPLVLDLKSFNTEKPDTVNKFLEVPQILNCNSLPLGEFNKAFNLDDIDGDTNKVSIPSVIIERF